MPPTLLAQIPVLRKMFPHKIFIHTTISCNKSGQYSSTHKRFSQSDAQTHQSIFNIQQQYTHIEMMKARHTTALYRTPRRIPDSATIEKPYNMHYLPLQNQPSAYIHKFLLSSSSSNTTHNNPSLLHHIKLPEHTSDHDVLQGQRRRDARPPAAAQHQHRYQQHYEAMVRIISAKTMNHYNP